MAAGSAGHAHRVGGRGARGTYEVYLSIPSAQAEENPDYAIQTANTGTWDPSTGLNDLNQKVTVG